MKLASLSASEGSTTTRFFADRVGKDGKQKFFDLTFDRTKEARNAPAYNPVLNVRVKAPIITGHGGIYSCQLMTFIGVLVTSTYRVQP